MARILLYGIGAIAVLAVLGVGYLIYITQKSVVDDNPGETTYDETGPIVNGFAIVTKHHPKDLWGNGQNRYGFVNANSQRITYVKYAAAEKFTEGLAFVRGTDGRCGFIDTTGREAIPLVYSNAGQFIDGICLVQKDKDGRFVVGFIDRQGREIKPFNYTAYGNLGDHYYPVGVGEQGREKWGYVDTRGHEIIAPQYDEASSFYNGYAVVGRLEPQRQLMFRGLVDSIGRLIIPFEYSSIGPVDSATGLIEVIKPYEENGRWHSRKGKVNLKHEFVEPLVNVPD